MASWAVDWLGSLSVTASDVATYSLLLLLGWLTYKAVEPLWSPLRKLPGLSYNPLIGNMRFLKAGEAMEATSKIIEKFGPLSRFYFIFGRERVLVADPDIMKHIFVTNARNYVKPPERLGLIRAILGNGLVTSEGITHAVHKRLLSPAFNYQSIAKMVPVFEARVRKLAELWSKSVASSGGKALLPVHEDLQRTTLDIIGLTAFGFDFNSLGNPKHEICVAFHNILSGVGLTWRLMLPFYSHLPVPEVLTIWKNIRTMTDVVSKIISEKRKLISEGEDVDRVTGDVLGKMILAHDEESGQRLSDSELRDHIMTLMLAGHETTAVAMAWCFLMLATHQDVQDKARREIISVVDPAKGLTIEMVDRLEYCSCVAKETLRLLPPVPMTLRKAENDDTLPGGHFIPAGTILNLSMGPMMRRREIFSDPENFFPERFLQKDTESNMYKFAPFIYGPRQCLGYRFALVEMKVILVILLQNFQFDLDPMGPTYKRQSSITMRPKPSLKLFLSSVKQ